MKYAYKAAPAALGLLLAFVSPAAAAPGPLKGILSAPFEITGCLVNFAVSIPALLIEQPHRVRGVAKARVRRAHRRKHRQPAYRFQEPAEDI